MNGQAILSMIDTRCSVCTTRASIVLSKGLKMNSETMHLGRFGPSSDKPIESYGYVKADVVVDGIVDEILS